jgi:tRNA(Ile2) C34 agmatinyltransferase TiaS
LEKQLSENLLDSFDNSKEKCEHCGSYYKKSENPLGYTCYDCHKRLLHEEERWHEYLQEYHEEMRRVTD